MNPSDRAEPGAEESMMASTRFAKVFGRGKEVEPSVDFTYDEHF